MQKNIAFAKGQCYAPGEATLKAKLLFLMRVSVFCFAMLITSLQLLASKSTNGQSIRETSVKFGVNKMSLDNALKKLQNESGIVFFYPSEKVAVYNNLSVDTKTRSVETILQLLLANTNLDFRQQPNNAVVVFQKTAQVQAPAPTVVVSGVVADSKGQPLPGVTIRLKGYNNVWATNLKGEFTAITTVDNAVLVFSYIGYITREIPVSQLKTPAAVELREDISHLDEVQVVAYGTTTKRNNTGDVTTIDAKTIAQYPTINALDALQGTVPGLVVYKNSGNANSTYKVRVRGTNGLTSQQPLYVIDGIPFQGGSWNSRNLTAGANTAQGAAGQAFDAMSLINPDDIESISVLKDADATSIYGSRGADGVILITTKKGKAGGTRVDASVYSGYNEVSHQQKLLNREQYLQMRREAYKNENLPVPSIITNPNDQNYDINGVWDTTSNTNWQKALLGGKGYYTKAQLGIYGGSDQVQYRINGGYNYSSSLESLGGSDQNSSVNLNINSVSKDKKFGVSFSGGYFYGVNTVKQVNLSSYISNAPDAPSYFLPNGDLNFQNNTISNPYVFRNYMNRTPQTNLTSSTSLSYKPITDLEVKLTMGYNKQTMNEFLGNPSTISQPYNTPTAPTSNFYYNNASYWSIEPQINYNKQLGKGKLSATIGASSQTRNSNSFGITVSGYTSDLLLNSPAAGTTIAPYGSGYQESSQKTAAIFGRVNYSWADKYFINISGRDDGSSDFGPNNQYHVFAAGGAAWIFSEESFIKNNLHFLSFGKLRGSYGSTGRDALAPYAFLSTYSTSVVGVNYNGIPGLRATALPNPDLKWETTKKAELGLELQFLKGRIALETNFYRNRTTDVLTSMPQPYTTGFTSMSSNLPMTVQNQGFDVTLTTTNIKSKNLSWSTTILFTRDRNVLQDFPNLDKSSFANTFILGQPVNIVKVYRFGGVDPQTGVYRIIAANGSFTSAPSAQFDRTQLININPNYYGSVQNNISYKQFSLSFLFRYMSQNGRNAYYDVGAIPPGLTANKNFPTFVLNRWQKPGDVTNIQRYGTNISLLLAQNNVIQSDAAYGDASYIRLQNVSLTYAVPQKLNSKLHVQNLQLFVQGDNLLLITGYNGFDPETQSNYTLPPLRIITAGLRVTL